ncbi:MAG: VWA domain-containing protein [Cytophagales bacterium]|nr:MAG: VWA domain-containing protein [Cytophagales bacterium]TAF59483.1 MAG: VWA domain-containing protein [Cytophagales bacterium]
MAAEHSESVRFFTEYSLWWILPAVLVALAYAWGLYSRQAPWTATLNRLLAGSRFVLVFLVLLLLLGWFVKQINNRTEKPIWAIALDNSESLRLVMDSAQIKKALEVCAKATQNLEKAGFDVHLHTLNSSTELPSAQLTGIPFTHDGSNLSELMRKVRSRYENENLVGTLLISDGIFNQGSDPAYQTYPFEVSALGLGDTVPQRDVSLKAVFHNKISYLGNKFPLSLEIAQNGFSGQQTTVSVSRNGNTIASQNLRFAPNNTITKLDFLIDATEKGTQHYVVKVQPLAGEFTTQNNSKHVYIDVIDSRERVLLVASSPHPDIKALRSAVVKNSNYEFTLHIPGIHQTKFESQYDLIIFHQVPDKKNLTTALMNELLSKTKATLFVTGLLTNYPELNRLNTGVKIQTFGNQTDKVVPAFNPAFNRFVFEDDKKEALANFPPLTVPFGDFQVQGKTDVLLYQRVGRVQTNKPLLTLNETENRKTALLLGEGAWSWRVQNYEDQENFAAFDDLITKTVQYLSTKEDKRKFRVTPSETEYYDTEPVVLEVEVYNDIYEPIYGQKINLQITDENKNTRNLSFVNGTAGYKQYIQALPQGIYKFKATTTLNAKEETSTGQFIVKALDIEAINTTADFASLRNLASKNNGQFYTESSLEALLKNLSERKAISRIHSSETFEEVIDLWWLLVLLLLLAFLEWGVRKYKGAY